MALFQIIILSILLINGINLINYIYPKQTINLRREKLILNPLGNKENPLVIAHRGASCCRPEHTISAYELALRYGAHYIEQDVVSSLDGELIVLHDRDLGTVSNIASLNYKPTNKPVLDKLDPSENEFEEEYFIEDFNLTEIKSFKTRQRFPFRGAHFNDIFPFVTLRELFQFVDAERNSTHDNFGVYIELKRPSYFRSIGLPLEEKFIQLLKEFEYILPQDSSISNKSFKYNSMKPLIIQCFESTTLKYFKDHIEGIPTILLIKENLDIIQLDNPSARFKDFLTNEGLKDVATYADGLGPHKTSILKFVGNEKFESTGLVKRAHEHGLVVHPYTFRSDRSHFLKDDWGFKNPEDEIKLYLEEGIDGFFTDFPLDGVVAYEEFTKFKFSLKTQYIISIILFGFMFIGILFTFKKTKYS